ncbi:AbrB family transcriptional regulator [Pseudomonas sp. WS 5013]|jgi:membrane AbrB-like protein|uniref:AbrB family transcriptional regulator n=1 Tax=Pseudomonas sp. WS 5013 TaxID=2717475 RepID=UPI0014763900|nr:AbrB family transcriptional regulator [Pseudomonas sp. WS 5013]NMY43086.1 AbrB family transcriptional regulator [Pseudomonas sp. WS 5013]
MPKWWLTPLAGAAGGALASLIGWPLPWMVGSLLAVILLRCLGGLDLREVPGARKGGQWLVGTGIGLHFSPAVLEQVLAHGGLLLAGALLTSLTSLIGIALLRAAGHDRATAFFASMPGGASEMVNLGQRNGAQAGEVAAGQSLRLLLVVLLVPALFQWWLGAAPALAQTHGHSQPLALAALLAGGALLALLGQRLRQPNPWLLGPILFAAAGAIWLDQPLSLPPGTSELGQWLIGSALGCHFSREFFRRAPRFLALVLGATLLAMCAAALAAEALGWLGALDQRSLMLGMMPGGIAELSLTAEALALSVPLITGLQVLRLMCVLFLAEPAFRLWQRQR